MSERSQTLLTNTYTKRCSKPSEYFIHCPIRKIHQFYTYLFSQQWDVCKQSPLDLTCFWTRFLPMYACFCDVWPSNFFTNFFLFFSGSIRLNGQKHFFNTRLWLYLPICSSCSDCETFHAWKFTVTSSLWNCRCPFRYDCHRLYCLLLVVGAMSNQFLWTLASLKVQ